MAKIITDEKLIDELLSRGVEEVIEKANLKKKLMSGKQLRIKLGVDPTSPNLHLGRSVPLLKLKDFQDLGHKAVFIVGDFTGLIGDTSDKDAERPMIDSKTIKKNLKSYKEQVGKIIDLKRAEFHFNSKWLKKLNFTDINELANVFSVNSFIQRDNIRRRITTGKRVSLREVLYPLMQGYDSVAVKSDVEIGGVDQRFNLLAGRTLQEHASQVPQNIVMTTFPVEGTDGRKMSSSWGNTINFLDTSEDMFGKVMAVRDILVMKYFNLLTRVSLKGIEEYKKQFESDPKGVKKKLAGEIVKMYHSEKNAEKAEENWENTFSKKEIPEDIKIVKAGKGEKLGDVLVKNGLLPSNSEFARRLKGSAVKDMKSGELIKENIEIKKDTTVKYGKKDFVKISVK